MSATFPVEVKASDIWYGAKDAIDLGPRQGYVRGYNVEVTSPVKGTYWKDVEWIEGEPDVYFTSNFRKQFYKFEGVRKTGRICFRGYGKLEYDPEWMDYNIVDVEYF